MSEPTKTPHLSTKEVGQALRQEFKAKIQAVEDAISQIKEKFGEGAIMRLKEAKRMEVETIPTGCLSLDIALGVGGVPRGRIIEIFGPEMSGKCVKEDTIIFSECGMLPISHFGDLNIPEFQKKEVMVHSENSFEKTSHFYNGSIKDTIRIKTRFGYNLEGTPNHRIRILDRDGNYLFRRLDELQQDDHVAIQRGQECFGEGIDLSNFVYQKSPYNNIGKDFKKFKITKEMARLMGYMIGDGTCTNKGLNKNNICITVGDKTVEQDLTRICKKIFGESPKKMLDKRTKHTKHLRIHNAKARVFLVHAGVGYWDASQKEIPYSIMQSPQKIVANFLSALFECDGCFSGKTIEYCSKSKKLVKQLQIVLLNFGIISKIIPRYNKDYRSTYYYLYIDGQKDQYLFAKKIGFIGKRKQNKLLRRLERIKQYHTFRDVIPNINKKFSKFLAAYRKNIGELHRKDWVIFSDYVSEAKRHSALTYDRLGKILKKFKDGRNLVEYQELEHFFNLNFFWDKIIEKKSSRARVLDFTVPQNATFFGNGFVNHNTSLSQHIIAEAQKMGGTAAFVDAEHALDPDYARRIGINIDDLYISQPDTGEQALDIVENLVRSNAIDVIVIDSVAALTPRAEIEGEMGDQHMGLQARLMSQALRKLAGIVSKSRTTVIFLNQIRMRIGVFFGNPETTTGGTALKFYSSVRIELRRSALIKQGDKVIGNRVRAKVVKNKVAPPFQNTEFDIMYNEGISRLADLIDTGLSFGVVSKSGNSYSFKETKLGVGRENAKRFLKENPKLQDEIKKKIWQVVKEKEAVV